ncbi:MAG: hypothetical protein KAJ51_08450 [Thermoplasmata archaeon]|nr:hypothetical protein [Thermoplasmata archaeon]
MSNRRKSFDALIAMNKALDAAEKAKKKFEAQDKKKGKKVKKKGQEPDMQEVKKEFEARQEILRKLQEAEDKKYEFLRELPGYFMGERLFYWYLELKWMDDDLEKARKKVDDKDWKGVNYHINEVKKAKKKIKDRFVKHFEYERKHPRRNR